VDPVVRAEFPGLRLRWLTVPGRVGSSPPELVRRLRELSNRYRGGGVVAMRTKPVPQAFRAFFRQIGLDPDVRRIPSEEAAVARLIQGGFRSVHRIADACLVALIETGVPVWALDAERVAHDGLGIRLAGQPTPGSLVVGDGEGACSVLFEDPPPDWGVGPRTRRVTLFAVAVDGVPEIHVEEALWCAADLLAR
jgi:DNA/RNA-binding domain of Phe-tRNA-synthetase-like protein